MIRVSNVVRYPTPRKCLAKYQVSRVANLAASCIIESFIKICETRRSMAFIKVSVGGQRGGGRNWRSLIVRQVPGGTSCLSTARLFDWRSFVMAFFVLVTGKLSGSPVGQTKQVHTFFSNGRLFRRVFIDAEIAAEPGQTVSYLCIDIVLFTRHLTRWFWTLDVSN